LWHKLKLSLMFWKVPQFYMWQFILVHLGEYGNTSLTWSVFYNFLKPVNTNLKSIAVLVASQSGTNVY
jgi:hypothetical protein